MEGLEPRFTTQTTLSTNEEAKSKVTKIKLSPSWWSSCDNQLVATEINGKQIQRLPKPSCNNQLVTIEKGITKVIGVFLAVKQTSKQNTHTITSTPMIQDQHVSDRQECDGGVIGCLNMQELIVQQCWWCTEQADGNTTHEDLERLITNKFII